MINSFQIFFVFSFLINKSVITFPNDFFHALWPQKNESLKKTNGNKNCIEEKAKIVTVKREEESPFDAAVKVEGHPPPQIGAIKCEKMEISEGKSDRKSDKRLAGSVKVECEKMEIAGHDFGGSPDQLCDEENVPTASRRSFRSSKEKFDIVQKFMQMKSECHAANDKRPYEEINKEIADKFGVSIRTISLWKRELGIEGIVREYSTSEKVEMLKQFDRMKAMNPQMGAQDICRRLNLSKTSVFKWKKLLAEGRLKMKGLDEEEKIEICKNYEKLKKKNPRIKAGEIAKKLNVGKNKLLELRKQFQLDYRHRLSNEERRKIIQKFEKIVNKKEVQPVTRKDKMQIAEKIGISIWTIRKWKSALGLNESPRYKNTEKIELLKKYNRIKRDNPKMSVKQIATMLNVSRQTLSGWKKQFDGMTQNFDSAADGEQLIGLELQHRHFPAQNAWEWNQCTGKRRQSRKRKLDQRN